MLTLRKIVNIDEEKCDGCGLCVPACAEGAIRIIDGKARLVSELYCDGLGACLGECPQGAISIEERKAEVFDEKAVLYHLSHKASEKPKRETHPQKETGQPDGRCPGAASQALSPSDPHLSASTGERRDTISSQLRNWPVQLRLAPVSAPYFQNTGLLVSADCTAFALTDFHRQFLLGHTLLVGCPKLDDIDLYRRKLTQIFLQNDIPAVDVLYMEVPCCFGLVQLVKFALSESKKKIPLTLTKISIKGNVCRQSGSEETGMEKK